MYLALDARKIVLIKMSQFSPTNVTIALNCIHSPRCVRVLNARNNSKIKEYQNISEII